MSISTILTALVVFVLATLIAFFIGKPVGLFLVKFLRKKVEQKLETPELVNVTLVKGQCAICGGPISEKWAGKDPSLGTKCETCWDKDPEQQVFGPENVAFEVSRTVHFDPLFGKYEYHFDWKGTKVMVNGEVGTVRSTQADLAWVNFPGEDGFGTPVKELGYWGLLRIYKESGGEFQPPPLDFDEYVPQKAELSKELLYSINKERGKDGRLIGVRIGESWQPPTFPFFKTLQAFCNLYVRWKYGLMPNFVYEGGFLGKDFEVRNNVNTLGSGIWVSVREPLLKSATTPKEERTLAFGDVLIDMVYEQQQGRVEDSAKDADAERVIGDWVDAMVALLRYDWISEPFEAIDDVWRCYCRMQDVLLNILSPEELKEALAFARGNEIKHFGINY